MEETTSARAVYRAISAITADLAKVGIAKSQRNESQGFAFRGIDQVYDALAPLLPKHGLVVIPNVLDRQVTERQTTRGGTLFSVVVTVQYDFVSVADGSRHCAVSVGEAMDSGDKATNKALSAAFKYAVFQTFCIPTEAQDADAETPPDSLPLERPATRGSVEASVEAIAAATTGPELKARWSAAVEAHRADADSLGRITAAKDAAKARLAKAA